MNSIAPVAVAVSLLLLSSTPSRGSIPRASALAASSADNYAAVVPEAHPAHVTRVSRLVSSALGDAAAASKSSAETRYASARSAVDDFQLDLSTKIPGHELVYGELSVPVLATILDAVGVREDDVFLDIGSGDGALVLGASLLYASCDSGGKKIGADNAMRKAWGVDIVPGLVDRSKVHAANLERILCNTCEDDDIADALKRNQAQVQFFLGDVHQPSDELCSVLRETTLAVCFATTWSAGNVFKSSDDTTNERGSSTTSLQGRKLPKLSKTLSTNLSSGSRVVIIDGKLDADNDAFEWQGDLRVNCPDTAPYSMATLYYKQ